MYAPRYWFGLLALVLVWGSSYAFIEVALPRFGPLEITIGRIVCGLFAVLLVCAFARLPWPRARGAVLRLAGIALFGNVAPFLLISWGQTRIDSAAAGVLMAVMPLSVLLFSRLLLPQDPLSRWHWIGFIGGLAGVVVLMAPDLQWPLRGPVSGHLAVLTAACSYGLSAVLARTLPAVNFWSSTALILTFGLLLLLPAVLAQGLDLSGLGANRATGSIIILGVLSTSLASVVFLAIVRGTSAAFVSTINFMIPIWAVLLGALVLGEALPPTVFAALVLVLAGVAVAQRGARSRATGGDTGDR